MRQGGGTVQHALTAEAGGVVKQAVVLAKRRGHAQVTPLHVANTMLSASTGLFRVACLKSHSHPLQCKALELCFNVALNRLPATASPSPSPILGAHHRSSQNPAISNALVAAFKRAQAHQRRGSIENQQQPILAVKIELDQLIISILDDPSVSRVMREAGFLSTQVKSNVEKEVSLELFTQTTNSSSSSPSNLGKITPANYPGEEEPIRAEDVNVIIETLQTCGSGRRSRRRSLAIVGESISNLQSLIKGLMDRIDRGEVPGSLKEVKFISIPPLDSFCNRHREDVEQKIGELTCLVKSLVEKGVVLYLGDLKWISNYKVSLEQERGYYCSVEHMIMEIGRLVWRIGETERFWLMGIATFQTYMRCRNGCQSLETVWGLHPVTIPANSLGLSLASDSDKREESLSMIADGQETKFEDSNGATTLPYWLKDECSRRRFNNDQNSESMRVMCNQWNKFCTSLQRQHEGTLTLLSSSSSPPFQNPNPNSTANSNSSSDVVMEVEPYVPKFREFSAENLNILCDELEKKVRPWERDLVQDIAGTVLKCRSGMLRRKLQMQISAINDGKEETWLFFNGPDDAQAKEKIAMELARIVFGSYSSFVSIGSRSDEFRRKRGRDEQSCCTSYVVDRFSRAVSANPHRVFFVEDFEQTDDCSRLWMQKAIERGRIGIGNGGEEIGFGDAIIVLSSEQFGGETKKTTTMHCGPLDLNVTVDDETAEDRTVEDLGILDNVDCHVVFRVHL
ncbi:protein SMAX1-LIKE 3-like [Andrographis paniculata]|uniref:protein SMAX1-LIKE 3-like n=1 Tax=Andrographis paniculata TaxID=175694 RepID=UPI0021E7587A|nr:protein SMAX1-LIKE 3-like [Andrographis paniculata]